MERQRGDQRADGPFPAVIGGEMGEATEGAPAQLQAPGQHRPRHRGVPNGDVDVEGGRYPPTGSGHPRAGPLGRPIRYEKDLSTRTSWPVTCSHSSVVGTVPCREAAPRATAWVSSA